ncbi:MAG: UDP-3-O-acyl-N-acetylglucosamine deacetylase [Hyphomicrobiales bacterium]
MSVRTKFTTNPSVQHTISQSISFDGKGVHGNQAVRMTLNPAPANTGVVFVRTSGEGRSTEIKARHDFVGATELCTIVGDPNDLFVATIEHLMAALAALSVDNVIIDITGPEVPVMDGSSSVFIEEICDVGLIAQTARRKYIKIENPIRVEMNGSWAEFQPYDGCEFDVEIDFDDPAIGNQRFITELTGDRFSQEISRARTFGFMKDVEKLWKAGYALGSSFENSVVIGDKGIMNPEGLRFDDEFVRHKLLDAVGDLALAGAPFLGRYRSYRGGHKLNYLMVKALFEQQDCWSYHELARSGFTVAPLTNIGVEPAVALAPSQN